jgi:hypothetical protein
MDCPDACESQCLSRYSDHATGRINGNHILKILVFTTSTFLGPTIPLFKGYPGSFFRGGKVAES